MPPAIRPITVLSACALALASSGCIDSECPGAGSALGLDSPELQYEWTTGGCFDSTSWVGEVEGIDAKWTLELRRAISAFVIVEASDEGPALVINTDLEIYDLEGRRLAQRTGVGPSFGSSFVLTPQGHSVVVALTGGIPQYRVFDRSGEQVWLRLLSTQDPSSGFPGLALDGEGKLWVALSVSSGSEFGVELQRWEVTGERLETLALPDLTTTWFEIDGGGRFAFMSDRLSLFDAQGNALGEAALDPDLWFRSLVGLPDGFAVGGAIDDHAVIVRVDGTGAVQWTTTLDADYVEYGGASVNALALTPAGDIVAVGGEDRIATLWPDSPLLSNSQPFVVGLDAMGRPSWGERIAASGAATGVGVTPDGRVFVAGYAQSDTPDEYGYADYVVWMRRYAP